MRWLPELSLGGAVLLAGCGSPAVEPAATPQPGMTADAFDVPISGVTHEQLDTFDKGDLLFGLQLREYDGLGPLYTRTSCGACHQEAARGPGFVQKMTVVEPDGVTPSADQSRLPFGHTVHPLVAAGATTPILPPDGDPAVKVTTRVGPSVLGRGYLEAIADSEIERVAREQRGRADGIHGRINVTTYDSEPNADTSFHQHRRGDAVIGRFGVKARIATLDEFTADALQGDMGITSPLRPQEFENPDGLADDRKPGVDVTMESVNLRSNYLRMIAIPRRPTPTPEQVELFARAKCAVCHAPSLQTRDDYPIDVLAGVEAPVFSDLLLHDMGPALADGLAGSDGSATSSEWRTAPLIGLRFNKGFMHDGRADTIETAIEAHGGEGSQASEAAELFRALTPAERQALITYVGSL
jgi:CxxC motif-containing protein (DUF1111 family)